MGSEQDAFIAKINEQAKEVKRLKAREAALQGEVRELKHLLKNVRDGFLSEDEYIRIQEIEDGR
jgi:uncharacterized protein YlxW (UPF0749 family)